MLWGCVQMQVEKDVRMHAPLSAAEKPLEVRELRLIFASSQLAVRRALRSTLGGLAGLDLTEDEASTVELVLAEVLNNVVEHAYAYDPSGVIEFQIRHDEHGLDCSVCDDGSAMPNDRLPAGKDGWSALSEESLPEGGFGWYLIRELAEDLDYRRDGNRNIFQFRLPVGSAFRTS